MHQGQQHGNSWLFAVGHLLMAACRWQQALVSNNGPPSPAVALAAMVALAVALAAAAATAANAAASVQAMVAAAGWQLP